MTDQTATHGPADAVVEALNRYRPERFGQLAQHIDPTAPLTRRALARYLCTYADLTSTTLTELAIRTHLTVTTVSDILAGKRAPTADELEQMTAVLGADPQAARNLWA
ncbi:helix-turn-helix domain-containing protein [Plantactinospora sp. CA-290183]